MEYTPSSILQGLHAKAKAGLPIVGVSTGIEANCEEVGGVDFIAVHSSDRYRATGSDSLGGFLAYGNANRVVCEMIPPLLQAFPNIPVLAGVCGVDPFLLRRRLLDELLALGVTGIQNHPTVGLIDGNFRKNLEESGMSFQLEVELVAEAHALGIFSAPFVFDRDQARMMAEAGADLLIAHPGLSPDATPTASLDRHHLEYLDKFRRISHAAKSARDEVLVLGYSATLGDRDDLLSFLDQCPEADGYFETLSAARLGVDASNFGRDQDRNPKPHDDATGKSMNAAYGDRPANRPAASTQTTSTRGLFPREGRRPVPASRLQDISQIRLDDND